MEGGIEELAKIPIVEIDKAKHTKDDIDVRLKWLGLFHRRKHQCGRFMMRLKLPNGVTTSAQTRYLASVIRKYGKEGCADVTTRQNWQIRGVMLPYVPEILDGLDEVGLTSLQSGMDNVRNPVGNPLAGIDPDEIVDTRPYTNLLLQFITANSGGNPAFANLPRKWNACVVGKRCDETIPLDAWIPGDDVIPLCKAMLEAFRDLGCRGNRQKTRMMWLIDELVQVVDIGFMGCMARDENGKPCEGANIFLGGRIGSDSHLGQVYKKGVPCKDLVPIVADILVEQFGAVPREREEGEY
ncbi:Ferredoxin--nitrite reductase [Hibiscus syriacus]|uniref:Ferredoxin--nitrite reductase n=1 Tax=Hibiscus syriacus TaxID=106335 RepID=A0A6A3BRW2_HIBSY|nr:Ferredoxin--nitrite reductase [Hibiscus syriacus]